MAIFDLDGSRAATRFVRAESGNQYAGGMVAKVISCVVYTLRFVRHPSHRPAQIQLAPVTGDAARVRNVDGDTPQRLVRSHFVIITRDIFIPGPKAVLV